MRWIVGLIILVGVLIRVPSIQNPPLDFHSTRQYRGAAIARSFYLEHTTDLTAQQATAARALVGQFETLEPPIVEYVGAQLYRLVGREDFRVLRAISALAWCAGAIALAWLLSGWGLRPGAVAAGVAVMMLLPFAAIATTAIQPDSLMTALTVLTVAVAVRFSRHPSRARLAVLLLVASMTVFVKSMAICFAAPVLFLAATRRYGWLRGAALGAALSAVAVAPTLLHFAINGRPQAEYGLFTALVTHRGFWVIWAETLNRAIGWPTVVAAVLGVIVAPPTLRPMLLAWWTGYVMLFLGFTYRLATHDYYSLPLIPIAAASIACLAARLDALAWRIGYRRAVMAAVVTALLAANAATVSAAGMFQSSRDLRQLAAKYRHIGEVVNHSMKVASLDMSYGFALSYHGYIRAQNLPLGIDASLARLAGGTSVSALRRLRRSGAEFFIATDQRELESQPDLMNAVKAFAFIERDGTPDRWRYLLYDLRRPAIATVPERISVFAVARTDKSSRGSLTLRCPDTLQWRVEPPDTSLFDVVPRTGTGPATLQIVAKPAAESLDRILTVLLFQAGHDLPSGRFDVRFKTFNHLPTTSPYGALDGSGEPFPLADEMVFRGWALDAFDLERVSIDYMEPGERGVRIGEATPAEARPQIAGAWPDAHDVYNNAWTLKLPAAALAGRKLPGLVRFYAENGEGQRTEIGWRSIFEP